jgi:hypothetical protein
MSLPSTAAIISTPNNKRLQRTSNPTPPEREDSKKSRRNNSSSSKKNMEKGKLDDIIQSSISQTVKISEDDTQKNAEAVKQFILSDIQHMIDLKTQPLIEKVNVLEKVNRQLTNDLDNLEQYGNRNLIRISGIPEAVGEVDTTETVRNLISEIDPEYKSTDVIRSHRVGKISLPGSFNSKTRQIIVRLADPSVKMRILRSRKNQRKSVYINEDLARSRFKIFYRARQLLKTKQIENLWTRNGKIIMKEVNGTINETNTPAAFRTLVEQLAPTYQLPNNF